MLCLRCTLCIVFLMIWPSREVCGKSIRLVENHTASAVIAIATQPSTSVRRSAKLLSAYLEKSTGAGLPIRQSGGQTYSEGITIHIGQTAYTHRFGHFMGSIDDDGFYILFPDEKNIVILGATDWGTEFGVYEFLERYVGVRWLMPGPHGDHVPQHPTLDIPMQTVHQEPMFFSRQFSGFANQTQRIWARRNRMHGRIAFHHNLAILFPPEKYIHTHPEFFPIHNGKRYLPSSNNDRSNWQPCFTAPGIVEEAIKNICHYFEKHPEKMSYSLGINDRGGFCECEKCQAARSADKNFLGFQDHSDYYFKWVNAVVEGVLKKYPDKWFGCLAYSHLASPPKEVSLNSRVIPYMTYDRMKWIDSRIEHSGKLFTESWKKKSPVVGWYDYIYGTPYLLPRVYFHKMAEYINYGYTYGVRAMYAESYPNWGEGPKLYIALKLLWNPNLNVDELLHEWYVNAVGEKAAPYLKAYYDFWEDFWTVRIQRTFWFARAYTGQYLRFKNPAYIDVLSFEELEQCRKFLEGVLDNTQTREQQARALLLFRAFEYYEASAISYLGLVKRVQNTGKDQAYYDAFNQKRTQLVNQFTDDPVLVHPLRFDSERFPALNWESESLVGKKLLDAIYTIWQKNHEKRVR